MLVLCREELGKSKGPSKMLDHPKIKVNPNTWINGPQRSKGYSSSLVDRPYPKLSITKTKSRGPPNLKEEGKENPAGRCWCLFTPLHPKTESSLAHEVILQPSSRQAPVLEPGCNCCLQTSESNGGFGTCSEKNSGQT